MVANTPIFFRDLAYIFAAAVTGALLARTLRQPLILGYVVAGILISPFTPGPSVSDRHSLELFAEIGVVLLMFSIGIEFSVRDLLRVKWVALVGGPLGIIASMLMGFAVSFPLGWSRTQGVVIGTVISVASTMVLARILMERGELRSEHGRVMIGITLVEDVAVVLLTVLLPTFGSLEASKLAPIAGALGKAALILIPLGLAASKIVPAFLNRIAQIHSQELFLIVILALCLGTAAITQAVGLSLALGAFLAGLLLSGSDYAREALGHLLPFRDVFVALFFVSIGLLIDPKGLLSNPTLLFAIVGLIVIGKALIWTAVVKLFRYPIWTALMVSLGLTQIGEFSFILVQVARDAKLVGSEVYNATLAASLLSILANAVIVRYGSRWVGARRLRDGPGSIDEAQTEELHNHVVLCGFGRIGGPAGTAFQTFGIPYIVIEIDPEVVKAARQKNIPCLFGDPAHRPILEAAHAERALLAVVTLPEADRAYLAVRNLRAMNQTVPILARAHRRADYESLLEAGATMVVQPEVEASAALIGHSLEFLGVESEKASAYLLQYREAMHLAQAKPITQRNAFPETRRISVNSLRVSGLSLNNSRIRERFGLTVVGIRRASGELIFNPPSDMLLQSGDELQVLGTAEQFEGVSGDVSPC